MRIQLYSLGRKGVNRCRITGTGEYARHLDLSLALIITRMSRAGWGETAAVEYNVTPSPRFRVNTSDLTRCN